MTSTPPAPRQTLIGIDEAGYGPNLGPLLVCAVALDLDAGIRSDSLWERLDPFITRYSPSRHRGLSKAKKPIGRLSDVVIDDSKKVYRSGKGLDQLECTALGLSHCAAQFHLQSAQATWPQASLRSFSDQLSPATGQSADAQPWFRNADIELPLATNSDSILQASQLIGEGLSQIGATGLRVYAEIVFPGEFNRLIQTYDSKAVGLFKVAGSVLRRAYYESPENRVVAAIDKHGGRNFYGSLLQQEFTENLVMCGRESAELSHYRITRSNDGESRQFDIGFCPKADSNHLLVAAASIVAKYLRESWMKLFNRYWFERVPGVQPTAGYPVDAVRFWSDIEQEYSDMGLSRSLIWRER